MDSAADCLEDLSHGVLKHPLLDVSVQGPKIHATPH